MIMQDTAARSDSLERLTRGTGRFPAESTAETLDQRLGLYLSPSQQRGLAIALLVGAAGFGLLLGSAVGMQLRR
jgi:hypothetical protein